MARATRRLRRGEPAMVERGSRGEADHEHGGDVSGVVGGGSVCA